MHPEIQQNHPGNCPKCGMTLEPLLPNLDEADENPELKDFKRRFWYTLPLTLIVVFLAMFGHQLNLFDMKIQSWIELILTLPIFLGRVAIFVRCWQSVLNRSPNMWTLIELVLVPHLYTASLELWLHKYFQTLLFLWDVSLYISKPQQPLFR